MDIETINGLYDVSMYFLDRDELAKYITNYGRMQQISGFLNIQILHKRKNWKCTACKKKLNTQKQIQTFEHRCPLYHIECYFQLHDLVIQKLLEHKQNVETKYENWNV